VCGQEVDLTAVHCETYTKATEALQAYFKFNDFRCSQLDALLLVPIGENTFVRMARNTGKSLCMFLAPLAVSSNALGVVHQSTEWIDGPAGTNLSYLQKY